MIGFLGPRGGYLADAVRAGRAPWGEAITGAMLTVGAPELVVGKLFGAGIGIVGRMWNGVQYTKSSLQLGRKMHDAYRLGEHAPDLKMFKEFRGIKGIRPDFVNFNTKTIFELKPNNPMSIHRGWKQLGKYRKAFEKEFGGTWNTVLME